MPVNQYGSVMEVEWGDEWVKAAKRPHAVLGSLQLPPELARTTQYQSNTWRQPPGWSTQSLFTAYQQSPWFRGVVRKIAYHFATVPWRLYKRPSVIVQGGKASVRDVKRLSGKYRKEFMVKAAQAGEMQEVENHPFLDLMAKPCPRFAGTAFKKLMCVYYDVTGEALAWIQRDPSGNIIALWPLSPNWLQNLPLQDNEQTNVYRFQILGQRLDLPPEDVLYLREPELSNPYGRGSGEGASLGDAIDTFEYGQEFLKALFYNRAIPDALIAISGGSDASVKRFQEQWENHNRGPKRAGRVFIHDAGDSPNGGMQVTQLNNNLQQLKAIELQQHERDEILGVFGIPPEMMGILEHSNKATIDQAIFMFAAEVLVPRLDNFVSEFEAQLLAKYDDRLLLEYDDPTPTDNTFTLQVLTAAPYAASVREVRKLAKLPDRGDQDEVMPIPVTVTGFTDDFSKMPIQTPEEKLQMAQQAMQQKPPSVSEAPPGAAPKPAEPTPTKPTKAARRKSPEQQKTIDEILAELDGGDMAADLTDVWKDELQDLGDNEFGQLGLESSFNLQNPAVVAHLKEFAGDRIKGYVTDTTRTQLRMTLALGLAAGEGIDDLAKRVDDVFDFADDSRAENIARTEVNRSSGFGTLEAYKQSGVVDGKQWVDTPDDVTRDEHRALGSQGPIPLDDDFEIDGETAAHPGDFGDPAMDCNCRCTIVAAKLGEDPKSADYCTAAWKKFDARATAWEHKAQGILHKCFAAQRARVQKAVTTHTNASR